MRCILVLLAAAACVSAQTRSVWNDLPAYTLSNGLIDVTVLSTGGSIASIQLAGDKDKLNPLWDPVRFAREAGTPPRSGANSASVGHFLCLDGFGGTSAEERSAGLPNHGEARTRTFETKAAVSQNGAHVLMLETELPLAQHRLTRTYEVREGENVVYVHTRLQSLVAFDRPVSWAEHATIGSPFLEAGVTVVDTPAKKAQTRPYTDPQQRRLAPGKPFDWPMAPSTAGKLVDLRAAPIALGSTDHTTQSMDPARTHSYATALHPQKHLIAGWIWRTADFPWLQNWESYPATGKLARGLEFSTQPFDVSRRQAVDMRSLLDTPAYQWIPAKGVMERTFVFFYSPAPEGMSRVSDVRVENGQILVEDGLGHRLVLRAAGSF